MSIIFDNSQYLKINKEILDFDLFFLNDGKYWDAVRADHVPIGAMSLWLVKAGGKGKQGTQVDIITLSLEARVSPEGLNEAVVVLFLKKLTLESTNPSNYYPVSNLWFLGKVPVIERAAAKEIQKFLNSKFLNLIAAFDKFDNDLLTHSLAITGIT